MSNESKIFRVINKRSLDARKKPSHDQLEYGEIAVNYNEEAPFIAFKASGGTGDTIVTTVTKAVFDSEHGLGAPKVENGVLTIPIPPGAQGAMGAQGETGAQGPQGKRGPRGSRGDMGAQGAIGSNGPRGDMGPQGSIGETGSQGEIGATGSQGARGAEGEQGDQ